MDRQKLGRFGEAEAAEFLLQKGYTELARNLRLPQGEIDLLMQDGEDVVVVEVKTQRRGGLFDPVQKITYAKQRKLWQLANVVAARYPKNNVRLEAVTLYWKPGATNPVITLYPLTP